MDHKDVLNELNTSILIKEYIRMIYGDKAEARVNLVKLKYGSVEAA